VAFAGDGRPDLAPALLAPPERRFARRTLARLLTERDEAFQSFDNWSDVVDKLLASEQP
jgi:2-hydroxy-3-keto-5-methylthiopentenyl-1-phosphate phosphatase